MGKKEDEPIGLQRGGPDPWSREARQQGRGTQRSNGKHGDESVSRDTVWIFSFQPRIDRGKKYEAEENTNLDNNFISEEDSV